MKDYTRTLSVSTFVRNFSLLATGIDSLRCPGRGGLARYTWQNLKVTLRAAEVDFAASRIRSVTDFAPQLGSKLPKEDAQIDVRRPPDPNNRNEKTLFTHPPKISSTKTFASPPKVVPCFTRLANKHSATFSERCWAIMTLIEEPMGNLFKV